MVIGTQQVRFTWLDGAHEVNAEGRFVRDYFSAPLTDDLAGPAANAVEVNAALTAAYIGPDSDGIGLAWQIDPA